MSIAEARRSWQLAVKAFGNREPMANVIERQIPGPAGPVRIRIYLPARGAAPRPALVWFHGGGFILGDLYTAGGTCRALANRSGAAVIAVRYRLAPEHDLLAGREDCLTAVRWVAEHGAEIGVDSSRIAVGGDSAGGNIAAFVSQVCAETGPELCLQLLVYPAVDLVGVYPSEAENGRGYFLTRESMNWIESYIKSSADLADARLSPLNGENLQAVPPAVVVTAGFDPVRDQGFAYLERLRAEGVSAKLLHYPGQFHGFLSFDRVLRGARVALDQIGAELSLAFEGSDEPQTGAGETALTWLARRLGYPTRVTRRRLRQAANEGIVGAILTRELLATWKDRWLGMVWGLWSIPSASEIKHLLAAIDVLERLIQGCENRIAIAKQSEIPDAK